MLFRTKKNFTISKDYYVELSNEEIAECINTACDKYKLDNNENETWSDYVELIIQYITDELNAALEQKFNEPSVWKTDMDDFNYENFWKSDDSTEININKVIYDGKGK